MHIRRGSSTIAVLIALAGFLVGGLPAPVDASNGSIFYLSLGTSLSVGTEPNSAGHNRRTQEGYADQLYSLLAMPRLQLVKLGCPGETSITMIYGGICDYQAGSQLAQAVQFLKDHRGSVAFVTIDVGANDIEPCGQLTGNAQQLCAAQAIGNVIGNLPIILSALRAADPQVPIIGMNYYNPFLAAWFVDPTQAQLSTQLQTVFSGALGVIYTGLFGIPVADVAAAFDSFNGTPDPVVPVNVQNICDWTYMCQPPPVGPNIHANAMGYGVIAQAFLAVLP
jgi:lysophospholipase L1-like esterase